MKLSKAKEVLKAFKFCENMRRVCRENRPNHLKLLKFSEKHEHVTGIHFFTNLRRECRQNRPMHLKVLKFEFGSILAARPSTLFSKYNIL